MRPQDIDKIATLVVGSLAGTPGAGLLGCGSITSGQQYEALCVRPELFACTEDYECGGLARFACCDGFECSTDFDCPGPSLFGCGGYVNFTCHPEGFACGGESFVPTWGGCMLPS